MNLRIDQKQDTRRRIVAAAAQAIQDRGLDDPSVSEVMKAAGLTVGGFYAHFENKDALLLEALRAMSQQRLAQLAQNLSTLPGAERRALAARYYLARKHRDGQVDRCPMPVVLGELNRVDGKFRDVIDEHFSQWADALTDPNEPDGRGKAQAAIATMVGALTIARALGATPESDQILASAKAALGAAPPETGVPR